MIAGVLREPLPSFLFIVAIAKTGRYIAVAALTMM
jgi:membrane protein YqaA with SNARE-associated domain